MKHSLTKLLLDNLPLKIISVALGYIFWSIISQAHTANCWISTPIAFYNVPHKLEVKAPEEIQVQLAGKRTCLWGINRNALAVHIDLSKKEEGEHQIIPDNNNLFLPKTIKLVHCTPCNISFTLTRKQATT